MSDLDPAVVEEQQALKEAFTYRSLRYDLDRLLDDTERAMFSDAHLAGRVIYTVASEFVIDCYFEKGALEPLVKAYSGQPYRVASRFDRLLKHLHEAQRADLTERFWTSITRLTRAEYFYQRPRREHGDDAGADEFKSYALEAYAQGIDWLRKLDLLDAAERLKKERDALREESFASLPAPTDRRRMDETVFWDLLAAASSSAPTALEQIAALGEALRAFEAAEIKRFGSLYAKWMKKLFHWNVWALAYAARGGCSDGAFEVFRTWLILQGDPDLVALAVTDPAKAAERVPPDPDLPDSNCMWLIQEAYFLRSGAPLEAPSIDLDKPKGREWAEENLATRYPQLLQHYSSAGPDG